MEKLLLGHFNRHSRPATHAELAELAELLGDDQCTMDTALAELVRTRRILLKRISVDSDAETVQVCYYPGQAPPNSKLAKSIVNKVPNGPSPEILKLRLQKQELQKQVDDLAALMPADIDIEVFIQEHIKRLHDYNEIKDIGQMLLGKCAEREQTTTRDMYVKFGLDFED
ncbi:hypothetical protein BDV3_000179 [Batrachochytrium dendrobatidis]